MTPISFLINTSVNTLDHVKLLIRSLKENLHHKEHEVLVLVDSDNEGTTEYLIDQKKNFFDLKIITHKLKPCIGYSRNSNLLVELAKHDVVAYLQSDMVVSKNYDVDVLKDLEDNCILSATRIEPPLHGESYTTITKDFGLDPTEFKWEEFLSFAETKKTNQQIEYFFAPFVFHKRVWLDVGGYDTQFRRGREDSDLLQRFVRNGVKIKQTFNANVYHFSCVASRGKNWFDPNDNAAKSRKELQVVADSIELRRFVKKWGGFSHGNSKLQKLDCDMVIKGSHSVDTQLINYLETYASRVWLESEEDRNRAISAFDNQHEPANKLLNFSEEDWNLSKRFYNSVDPNYSYKVGRPEQYNVLIEIDLTGIDVRNDQFISNLSNLYQMIDGSEPGIYELGCARIEVVRITDSAESNTVVINPEFDMSLLKIQ